MATVWELIQENSTAPQGSTFWEHLNAQTGGGTGSPYPVYYKDIQIAAASPDRSFSIAVVEQTVDVSDVEMETVDTDLVVDKPTIKMETE